MKNLYIVIILFILSIKMNAQPVNETCATATVITNIPTASYDTYYFNDIETGTATNEILCADVNTQDYVAVWYDIEMPINGNLYIDAYQNYNHVEVYDVCGGIMLSCFSNEGVVFSLTQNSQYKIKIYRKLSDANNTWKQFRVRALSTATNNNCADAESISLSTTRATINFDIKGSSSSNQTICSDTQDFVDVWYDFTLTELSNVSIISGASGTSYNKFAVYDACAGNEVACFNKEAIVEDLVAGTYKLRMYRTSNLAFTNLDNSFTISSHQRVVNDAAAASENIAVTNVESTVNFDPIGAALENEANVPSCVSVGVANNPRSLWYHFTMPFNGNIYIDSNSSVNDFEVYNADASIQLKCFDRRGLISNLISGTNYKVRVFRSGYILTNLYASNSFTIRAFDRPLNDDCLNAETISLTETLTTYQFSVSGAVPDTEASCSVAAGDYYDVWYDFTMPATPSNLYIQGQPFAGNKYAIYDACGGTELYCFSITTATNNDKILSDLIANTNYKLRVYRSEGSTGRPDGLIHEKFKIKTYPKITNTTCATSQTIIVTEANTFPTTNFNGSNLLENQLICNQNSNNYFDAWFSFVMPVSGNLILSSTASNSNFYELFDACEGISIACENGNTTIQNLVIGNTYKLRVLRRESNLVTNPSANNNFIIVALAIANNDTCATAENISVSEIESTVNFEIISAQLNTEEGCSGTASQSYADIWYGFTMPSFDSGNIIQGNILIDGTANINKFSIYDACNGTEIDCFEQSKMIENLTSGTNYKIRVYRTATDYTNSNFKWFKITAFADSQNDDCASSENITVTNTVSIINFEFGGAESNLETICTTEDTFVDIWYDFILAEAGSIQITNAGFYDGFELYNACAGSQIGCFTASNGDFNNLVSGTSYKLRVFRPQNQNQFSVKSFEIAFQSTLGINDYELSSKVKIYPNPATNIININSQISIDKIELFDLVGKKVLTTKQQIQLNIGHLQAGIYLLKVTTNQGQLVKRIVLK